MANEHLREWQLNMYSGCVSEIQVPQKKNSFSKYILVTNEGKGKNTTHLSIFTSTYQERSTIQRFLWRNFMDLKGIWNGSILVLARFSHALSSKSQTHKPNILMWTLNFFPIFPPQSIPYSFESLNEREK